MRALVAIAIAALAVATPGAARATPTADHPLEDRASVVPDADEPALEAELRALRADGGVRLGVVVVDTTGGQPIEDYARFLAAEWSAGSGSAALLVLAISDRASRLEVNDALRAALPDARARAILDNVRGYLQGGDYAGAIRAVAAEVRNAAAGVAMDAESPYPQGSGPAPAPVRAPPSTTPTSHEGGSMAWVGVIAVAVILLGALAWAKARAGSRATLTAGLPLPGRPLWLEWIVCVGMILGAILMLVLIVATSGKSSGSSSSRGWSGGGSSGGGGGGGGGWSGGGASSSW